MESHDDIRINSETNQDMNNNVSDSIILVIDIGTTNLKTSIFDENFKTLYNRSTKVNTKFTNVLFSFLLRWTYYSHTKVFPK